MNETQKKIDQNILNLKILSKIKENDKLLTNNELLEIDSPHIFQSINRDSKEMFKDLYDKTCFISLKDMKEKISFFLKNSDQLESFLVTQQKNFESEDFNYETIKKVKNFIYNI